KVMLTESTRSFGTVDAMNLFRRRRRSSRGLRHHADDYNAKAAPAATVPPLRTVDGHARGNLLILSAAAARWCSFVGRISRRRNPSFRRGRLAGYAFG